MLGRSAGGAYCVCFCLVSVVLLLPFFYERRMFGAMVRIDYYLLWLLGIISWIYSCRQNSWILLKSLQSALPVFAYLILSWSWFYFDDNSLQVLITLFCCLGIFHFLSQTLSTIGSLILPTLFFSCAIQLLIATGQLNAFGSNTLLVRGQFFNSGYFGNYLASLIPLFFSFVIRREEQNLVKKILCLVLLGVCFFFIFRIAARAAIIGSLLGCLGCFLLLQKERIKISRLRVVALLMTIFLAAVCISLFMKINSARGRITIYEIGLRIFKDHFLFGVGPNRFAAVYNNYQSEYFRYGTKPVEVEILATNTLEGFNIVLQFLAEYGMLGLLLLVIVLYRIFRNMQNSLWGIFDHASAAGHAGCLISIFVAGLFSNPVHMTPVQLLVIVHLAGIFGAGENSLTGKFGKWQITGLALSIIGGWIILYSYKQWNAEITWRKAANFALFKGFDDAESGYRTAAKSLKHNGAFLFNYGAEAALAGDLVIAVELLEKSKLYISVNNLYLYLGDVYLKQGEFKKAEENYLHAVYMVPSALYSKYKLIECYIQMGQNKTARIWSEQLLNFPVKVRSEVTDMVREEVRNYLRKF